MSLPNLDQTQPLDTACPSALFVALRARFPEPHNTPSGEVYDLCQKLRTILHTSGVDLDAPNPAAPTRPPGSLSGLHPVHIQTIENLVAKVQALTGSTTQIDHLHQQAESVETILERLKAGTLKGPDSLPEMAYPKHAAKPGEVIPTVTTPSAVPSKPPMVRILWRDSAQPIVGWRFMDDLPPLRSVHCESIGYVVAEDAENIMLAQSIGDRDHENQQANACMVIPKCCIVERITLGLAILHT